MNVFVVLQCLLLAVPLCSGSPPPDLECKEQTLSSNNYEYSRSVVSGARQIKSMEVVEQISNSDCTLDKSFGFYGADVWVHRGCRANFRICYLTGTSSTLSCISNNFNYKECDSGVPIITDVYPINQNSSSPCLPDFSYGQRNNLVWVDKGCRAEFRVTRA